MQQWYKSLNKPKWAPKPMVYGQVWSVIYPIIFIANIYVLIMFINNTISWVVALPFWLNLLFNFAYTPAQFKLRNQLASLIVIILVLLTIVWSMVMIYPYSVWVFVAFIPYLIWVSIATVLQTSLWRLNR